MKKILLFVLIGIIFATFASATGETLNRVISTSTVNAGNTFTVYYNVPNPNGAFVFSIKDTITGGCTVSTGGVDIIKLLTSPDTQTTSVTINTPSYATICTFNGDYQLGSNPLVNFSVQTVTVHSDALLNRTIPSTVNGNGLFNVSYRAIGFSGPYFFSIVDRITGGCVLSTGGTNISKTLVSPDTETTTVTVIAPASGSCTFTGDYQLGSNPILNFTTQTITILTTCTDECSPSGTKTCSGSGYKTCGNYDSDLCSEWSTITSCTYGCNEGVCLTPACNSNSECGSPSTTHSCSGSSAITTLTTPTCINPGILSSYCTNNAVIENTEVCEYGCFNGVCMGPCQPNWVANYGSCLSNNSKFVTYSDSNNCGDTLTLPSDDHTYIYCDYNSTHDFFVVDYIKVEAGGKSGNELTNGKTVKGKATPESEVVVKIKMLNEFSEDDDIDIDVDATVTIKDIDDGSDLEEEDSTTIEADDKETMEFTFKIPKEVEEKTYTMEVDLEAEDDNGRDYLKSYDFKLRVDKEQHMIEIEKDELNPMVVSCNEPSTLSVSVLNMGSHEEKKARMTIVNSKLGINFDQLFKLNEAPDRKARFKTEIAIDTTDIPEGEYSIPIKVYYDNDKLTDTKTAVLTVNPCVTGDMTVPYVQPTPETVIVIQPLETPVLPQPPKRVKYCCDSFFGMCLEYCYK